MNKPNSIDAARPEANETTLCGVTDCDGIMHDENDVPANWDHRVSLDHFDGNAISLEVVASKGMTYTGNILMEATGDAMTAADLRAEALKYEQYPSVLRNLADRLDALNV